MKGDRRCGLVKVGGLYYLPVRLKIPKAQRAITKEWVIDQTHLDLMEMKNRVSMIDVFDQVWSLISVTFDGDEICMTREFLRRGWSTLGLSTQHV